MELHLRYFWKKLGKHFARFLLHVEQHWLYPGTTVKQLAKWRRTSRYANPYRFQHLLGASRNADAAALFVRQYGRFEEPNRYFGNWWNRLSAKEKPQGAQYYGTTGRRRIKSRQWCSCPIPKTAANNVNRSPLVSCRNGGVSSKQM